MTTYAGHPAFPRSAGPIHPVAAPVGAFSASSMFGRLCARQLVPSDAAAWERADQSREGCEDEVLCIDC
jgi:hypothetical protein